MYLSKVSPSEIRMLVLRFQNEPTFTNNKVLLMSILPRCKY